MAATVGHPSSRDCLAGPSPPSVPHGCCGVLAVILPSVPWEVTACTSLPKATWEVHTEQGPHLTLPGPRSPLGRVFQHYSGVSHCLLLGTAAPGPLLPCHTLGSVPTSLSSLGHLPPPHSPGLGTKAAASGKPPGQPVALLPPRRACAPPGGGCSPGPLPLSSAVTYLRSCTARLIWQRGGGGWVVNCHPHPTPSLTDLHCLPHFHCRQRAVAARPLHVPAPQLGWSQPPPRQHPKPASPPQPVASVATPPWPAGMTKGRARPWTARSRRQVSGWAWPQGPGHPCKLKLLSF